MKRISLSIPEPCHQNWHDMTPAEKGRFCAACQKQVIDFSNMTDGQLAAFFKNPATNVCGRFAADQLDKALTVPAKRWPFIKYFFIVSVPAFLLSLKSGAQKLINPRPVQQTPELLVGKVAYNPAKGNESQIFVTKGRVTDISGKVIPGATVMAVGAYAATATDSTGAFKLISKDKQIDSVLVSSIGYDSQQVKMIKGENEIVLQQANTWLGEVVVMVPKRKKDKPIPTINKNISESTRQFTVYPNPVNRNTSCKINAAQLEAGTYRLSLTDNAGIAFCHKQVIIDRKNTVLELNVSNVAPGMAYVQLQNMKTGKVLSEKIIIK